MICYVKPDRLKFKFGNRIGEGWSWKLVFEGIETSNYLNGYHLYVFEFIHDSGRTIIRDKFRCVSGNTPKEYMVNTLAFNHRLIE